MKISEHLIKKELTTLKPNKDVGTCLRRKNGVTIYRSKYKTSQDAQEQLQSLLSIGVISPLCEVYKCPVCHMWHIGLKEWANNE